VLAVDGARVYRGSLPQPAPCTNNEAEYGGLLLGLRALQRLSVRVAELHVQGDSELVINQCTGAYACEAANLRPLLQQVRRLLASPPLSGARVSFEHIPRDQNAEADALAFAGVSGGFEDNFIGSSSSSSSSSSSGDGGGGGGGGGGAGAIVASSQDAGGAGASSAALQPQEGKEPYTMELTAEEAAEMDKFLRETFVIHPKWPADRPHPGALSTDFFRINHWKGRCITHLARSWRAGSRARQTFLSAPSCRW
jgi:ribonuclease HI